MEIQKGFKAALQLAFPEIGFAFTGILVHSRLLPHLILQDEDKHGVDDPRTFFDEFAKEKGFDPLVQKNWIAVYRVQLLRRPVRVYLPVVTKLTLVQGCAAIVRAYGGLRRAIEEAYPEANFDLGML